MKKFLVLCVVLVLLTSVVRVDAATSQVVEVENLLEVPYYGVLTFSLKTTSFGNGVSNFQLFDSSTPLPLSFSRRNEDVVFKTAVLLDGKAKKTLKLAYGDMSSHYTDIFLPRFFGTKFVCIGPGRLFIVSCGSGNSVKVIDRKNSLTVFTGVLANLEYKFINLNNNSLYSIEASRPVFAEFSTLTPPFDKNSSDDMSAVFGVFFKLYIPKTLCVTADKSSHLKIIDSEGKVVFEGDIDRTSPYVNTNLKEGVYTISSTNPVLIEYGYADDNIFSFLYGVQGGQVISFGGLGVSSIFPDTQVTIKYKDKMEEVYFKNTGEFKYFDILKDSEYKQNLTEYKGVDITFTKPVLIYNYSQFGNVDGEQIPGFSNNTHFAFRTGKVTKIYGERKRRVIVVSLNNNTRIEFNGSEFTLNAYEKKVFLFGEGFSPVDIEANNPIAVFDGGIEDNKEILTTLLPIDGMCLVNVSIVNPGGTESGDTKPSGESETFPPSNTTNKFIEMFNTMRGYIRQLFTGAVGFVQNLISNTNMREFFKKISTNILEYLRPISLIIYNYIKDYIPGVSVDIVSSVIFGLLVMLVIILIVPKGRKEKVPVVSIEEVKKKPITFDIKDIEVREEEVVAKELKTIPLKKEEVHEEVKTEEIEKEQRVFRPIPPLGKRLTIEKEELKEEVVSKPPEIMHERVEEHIPPSREEAVIKEEEISFVDFAQPKGEKPYEVVEEEKIVEKEKPVEAIEQKPAQTQAKKEAFKSTFEELLSKLEQENIKKIEQAKEKGALVEREEKGRIEEEKAREVMKEARSKVKVELGNKFVLDADSLKMIYESSRLTSDEKTNLLNRAIISASQKSEVNYILEGRFKVTVIALSQIEERLAEDIAKRISGKFTTAEAVLIAKKVRLTDVIVSDTPKLRNHQGVNIYPVGDILDL